VPRLFLLFFLLACGYFCYAIQLFSKAQRPEQTTKLKMLNQFFLDFQAEKSFNRHLTKKTEKFFSKFINVKR